MAEIKKQLIKNTIDAPNQCRALLKRRALALFKIRAATVKIEMVF